MGGWGKRKSFGRRIRDSEYEKTPASGKVAGGQGGQKFPPLKPLPFCPPISRPACR